MENTKTPISPSVKWGAGPFGRLSKLRPFAAIAKSTRMKLLVSVLALALIPILTIGFIAYTISSKALMKKAFDNLEDNGYRKLPVQERE